MSFVGRLLVAVAFGILSSVLYLQYRQIALLREEVRVLRESPARKVQKLVEENVEIVSGLMILFFANLVYLLFKFMRWFFRISCKAGYSLYYLNRRELAPVTIDKLDSEPISTKLEKVVEPSPPQIRTVVPESYVQGSDPTTDFKPPSFQCYIDLETTEGWRYSGVGIRDGAALRYPTHVAEGVVRVRLRRSRNDTVGIEVTLTNIVADDVDFSRSLVDPAVFSQLGITTAKFVSIQASHRTVHCTDGLRQTSGLLRKANEFGYVYYGGSTWSGFSGAAYYVNNTVYGMHTSGGTVNYGFDATYMHALCRPEDSYDLLIENIKRDAKRGKIFRAIRRSGAGSAQAGEGYVDYGGRYHFVDASDLEEIRDALEFEGDVPLRVNVGRESAFEYPDSGNVVRVAATVAAHGPQEVKPSAPAPKRYRKPAQNQPSAQPAQPTDGQPSTPVPQSEVFSSMLQDMKKLLEKGLAATSVPKPSVEQKNDALHGSGSQ